LSQKNRDSQCQTLSIHLVQNMSNASVNAIAWFNYVNVQMNRYFPIPFIVLGTIGVILNTIIFTRRNLFQNSCVQYLLGNTLSNLIVLYWVALTRIFSDGYNNDLSVRSDTFCKIRYFLTYFSRALSTWFIVLACCDRWLSSTQARNRYNTVIFARQLMAVTCIVCFLAFFHVLFLFGVQTSSTSVTCYARSGIYRLLSDLQYLTFYALGPPILMLIFGLLTLKNLRNSRRLVLPNNQNLTSAKQRSIQRRDNQLLMMLLLQVMIIILFTLPFAIQKLVDTFIQKSNQTPVQKAQYDLIAGILRLISYGSHAFGFFFYTLSAKIFRNELLRVINRIYQCFAGKDLISPARTDIFGGITRRNDIDMTQTV